LPTATGNGIDPADTTEPGLAAGVAPPVALVAPAGLEAAPAGVLDPAGDVPADEPHPASANTAAAAKTARADLYLLMLMPRSVKVACPRNPPVG